MYVFVNDFYLYLFIFIPPVDFYPMFVDKCSFCTKSLGFHAKKGELRGA